MNTLTAQILFLGTGIMQTLLVQVLYNYGAANDDTFLIILANYYGMMMAYFMPNAGSAIAARTGGPSPSTATNYWSLFTLAVVDGVGYVFNLTGIMMAGSGLFAVFYANLTVVTAVLSRFVLNKHLSPSQWLGLLGITGGMMVCGFGKGQTGPRTGMGILFTLIGTFLFGCYYVMNERLMKSAAPPHPRVFALWVGGLNGLFTAVYVAFYTVPRWQETVIDNMDPDVSGLHAIGLYAVYIAATCVHAWAFFTLVERTGAVSTGVLQALRSVTVFGLSAVFFCANMASQCYNRPKGVGTVMVILGVLYYARASQQEKDAHAPKPETTPENPTANLSPEQRKLRISLKD